MFIHSNFYVYVPFHFGINASRCLRLDDDDDDNENRQIMILCMILARALASLGDFQLPKIGAHN